MDGLVIDTNASTIRSLIINRFNGEGIILSSGLGNGGNIVRNCFIGTDSSGTVDLGNNGIGVYILSPDNRIGGGNAATRNLISGNGSYGVQMFGASATGNTINGNYIGTTVSGTVALGNTLAGIIVQFGAVNNTIGGSTAGEGNLISGNGNTGILLAGDVLGSGTNTVIGNLIGTTANGNAALGNASGGVTIIGSINNRIGGTTVGERNVISGNLGGGGNGGVNIGGSLSSGNIISGNYIGTNIGGNAGVGNALYGVRVDDASNNRIGGTLPGEGNTIAFNGSNGVLIFQIGGTAVQNSIRANSIFSNVGIGIDLSPNSGVTANDLGDPDTGANNLQNYPVITGALTGSTRVIGTFNSTPSRQFRLEFFNSPTADASGNGEGQFFVGSFTVTTNGGGNVAFDQIFAYISAPNTFVAATATDLTTGDTSEFSVAKEILSPSAASVTVSGRVVTADGRGLGKVKVSITGPDSFRREALTNAFGFYGFPDIPVGESYVLNADHKRYQFSSRLITVLDEISELDFIALESQHFPSSGERSKLIGIQSK